MIVSSSERLMITSVSGTTLGLPICYVLSRRCGWGVSCRQIRLVGRVVRAIGGDYEILGRQACNQGPCRHKPIGRGGGDAEEHRTAVTANLNYTVYLRSLAGAIGRVKLYLMLVDLSGVLACCGGRRLVRESSAGAGRTVPVGRESQSEGSPRLSTTMEASRTATWLFRLGPRAASGVRRYSRIIDTTS